MSEQGKISKIKKIGTGKKKYILKEIKKNELSQQNLVGTMMPLKERCNEIKLNKERSREGINE